jgi:uncharacterized membrane protein
LRETNRENPRIRPYEGRVVKPLRGILAVALGALASCGGARPLRIGPGGGGGEGGAGGAPSVSDPGGAGGVPYAVVDPGGAAGTGGASSGLGGQAAQGGGAGLGGATGAAPLAYQFINAFGGFVPTGINRDGTVVVGFNQRDAVSWTAATGPTTLATLAKPGTGMSTRALAVSADGKVIVGEAGDGPPLAVRWTDPTTVEPLADSAGSAIAVSADGSTILCLSLSSDLFDSRSFVWKGRDITVIEPLPGDSGTEALLLSADGSTAVGRSWGLGKTTQRARLFFWTAAAGTQELALPLDETMRPDARGISADGSVVVGHVSASVGNAAFQRVFRWTRAAGAVYLTPASGYAWAGGVTADGALVVGADSSLFLQSASGASAMLPLAAGSSLPGMVLDPNGRYLAATSSDNDFLVWSISPTGFTPVVVPAQLALLGSPPVAISGDGHTLLVPGAFLVTLL